MFDSLKTINWTQLFVSVYIWLVNTSTVVYKQTTKTTRFIVDSAREENYVFFEGSTAPVYERNYENRNPGSSKVLCIYNKDTNTLILDATRPARTLEFSTAELYHGDICLYDLTNFFDTTLWKGDRFPPSLSMWMGVWSLVNSTYLDTSMEFRLCVTTMDGRSTELDIWSTDQRSLILWENLNEVKVRLQRVAPVVPVVPVAPVAPVVPVATSDDMLDEPESPLIFHPHPPLPSVDMEEVD
jgi:hypothetical protein